MLFRERGVGRLSAEMWAGAHDRAVQDVWAGRRAAVVVQHSGIACRPAAVGRRRPPDPRLHLPDLQQVGPQNYHFFLKSVGRQVLGNIRLCVSINVLIRRIPVRNVLRRKRLNSVYFGRM